MSTIPPAEQQPWSTLRRFVRPRPPVERCELCSAPLATEHPHLLEPSSRQLRCCCDACAILFSDQQEGRYRRVPSRVEALPGFRLEDERWEELHLPINLAFFVRSTAAGRVQAFFPSPAGATESLLTLEAWDALAADNPGLGTLEPDVEALLVNRMNGARDCYLVSIDECYKLVGLIRTQWRGLSGGTEVWDEIGRFFDGLDERSRPTGGTPHARPGL
jgi:hypothetical protein